MRINAINPANVTSAMARRAKDVPETEGITKPEGFSIISFRGGNKGDVLHVVAECKPFNQAGGVATVVEDYKKLNNISPTEKGRTVLVTPYYNGIVKYDSNWIRQSVELPKVPEGLPDGHILKGKEGQPIYVKADLGKQKLIDVLKTGKDFWLLEDVKEKKMTWGMQEDAPIRLLKVKSDAKGQALKDDIYMIFSEATAYYPSPYAEGQYSSTSKAIINSWNGDPYAKFDKAVVEFMEDITKHMNNGFDPGTVVCSDSQAAYVTHYMAQRNAAGQEFFKGKKPIQIGHNLGDGYIAQTGQRGMLINLDLFKPEELKALVESEEFVKAMTEGGKAETEFYNKFLKGFTAENKLSAMSIATHYGNKGFLPAFGLVSQGYLDEVATNPELTPFMHKDIAALKAKGVAIGLTNPHNGNDSAFNGFGPEGYKKEVKIKFADGTEEVIQPMKTLKGVDKSAVTLEQVKALKRENKINFLTRFLPKYDNVQYMQPTGWSDAGVGTTMIRAGMSDKSLSLVQNVNAQKYIDLLKSGKDVNVIVSWGRGDFQKAFDEVLTSFKKYVAKTKDENAILVLGGDLSIDKVEGSKVKDIAALLSKDKDLSGRVLLMDGFSPGNPMAMMADAAVFPSRFAPCELTDLEAKKLLCTPIVADGQGLRQKNFDPDIPAEAAKADSFKTKHQFYSSREDMLKVAKDDVKNEFNKIYAKAKNEITARYKHQMSVESVPDNILEKILLTGHEDKAIGNVVAEYKDALRKLRDEVMTDELADSLERCLITHKNDDVAKTILKNQINIQTGWENNQAIIRSDNPSGELYRALFKKDAKSIESSDVIGFGAEKPKPKTSGSSSGFWTKLGNWAHSKGGKWTIGIAAATAVAAGVGYAGYKNNWFSPKYAEEKTHGELSVVG